MYGGKGDAEAATGLRGAVAALVANLDYYEEEQKMVDNRLEQWNMFATMSRPVLTRKFESVSITPGMSIKVLDKSDCKFQDFITMVRKYESTSIRDLIAHGLKVMARGRWEGALTPNMCICGFDKLQAAPLRKYAHAMQEL